MNTYQTPAERDAARLNSVGIEADAIGDTTYAVGAESGDEFVVYRTPYSGYQILGESIKGSMPSLVAFLRSH